MDLTLTPRSVISIEKNRVTLRTVDISVFIGTNTVASVAMGITDSNNTDVTATFGKGATEDSGTVSFGILGYATGQYLSTFTIVLEEVTPDGTPLTFTFEIVLIVADTPTSATAATAEVLEAYALVTLDECKLALNISLSTSTYDSNLIHLINDATAAIESHCEDRFSSTAYTERYDGTGRKLLYLNHRPIISVSSITVDGTEVEAATEYDDDDKYWIEPNRNGVKMIGALYRANEWDVGSQNVLVTYTAGYASIPHDIRRAANMLINEWYNIYQNKEGKKSESISRYSYTFAMIPPEIKDHIYELLDNYTAEGYH